MMPNLSEIYDEKFFEEWGSAHQSYIDSAKIITEILCDQLKPKSLFDVGCGCGVYTHLFKDKDKKVIAIDGVIPAPQYSYPIDIEKRDLTVPFDNEWGKLDFALCLEVAEHIPEKYADVFLDNLTRLSDVIVLSAAPPNQGGHHHVNEQPKRYWVQKLSQKNFIYNRKKTGTFVETFKRKDSPYKWMGEHISIYERSSNKGEKKVDLPFGVRF